MEGKRGFRGKRGVGWVVGRLGLRCRNACVWEGAKHDSETRAGEAGREAGSEKNWMGGGRGVCVGG